jgi:stage V sporulation protein G
MSDTNLEVRVYPIDEPKGNTVAFATATVEDLVAITGIKVISGEKGLFVKMPQVRDKDGEYRDIAFPVKKGLRKELSEAVLSEYDRAVDKKKSIGERLDDGAAKAATYNAPGKSADKAKYKDVI